MNESHGKSRSFAAALIAGGQSRRMGQDKAWLDWKGEPLWQYQLHKLAELKPAKFYIACREEQRLMAPGAENLIDPPNNQGPLPALSRCLERAQMPVLALAVDMPHVTTALLRELVQKSDGMEAGAVCQGTYGYEPLCALYPAAVLPLLHDALGKGHLRLQDFVQKAVEMGLLRVIPLSKEREPLFFNLNTPADLP